RKYILGSLAAISIIGIVAGTCAGVCYKNTTKSNLDNKTNSSSITSKNDSNATNQNNRTTKNDHDSIKTQNSGTNPDKNDREKTSTGSNNNPSSKNPNSTHNKESNSSPDISHSSSSQPPVGPGPVVNPPRPHHLNDLNYDLNINDNEVSPSSNIINLNYLTNSFSLSNIEYSNHLVDVTNGNCSLTYVITNLSDNKVLTTKNITSTSNSN
ncbi:hypothetical protein IKS57_06055, partial [bacterium]|nr:hypothetical protein [bacterium]